MNSFVYAFTITGRKFKKLNLQFIYFRFDDIKKYKKRLSLIQSNVEVLEILII